MGTELRSAIPSDVVSIVSLATKFWKESNKQLPFEPVFFSSWLMDVVNDDDSFCEVLCVDSCVVGVFIGKMDIWPAANVMKSQEVLWYVSENSRGVMSALKMPKRFIDWSVSKGCELIFAGAHMGKARKVYEKLGFSEVDVNMVKVA